MLALDFPYICLQFFLGNFLLEEKFLKRNVQKILKTSSSKCSCMSHVHIFSVELLGVNLQFTTHIFFFFFFLIICVLQFFLFICFLFFSEYFVFNIYFKNNIFFFFFFFFRTAVLQKLFDMRFSYYYEHCNFPHGCLKVKMASKTVYTRSLHIWLWCLRQK